MGATWFPTGIFQRHFWNTKWVNFCTQASGSALYQSSLISWHCWPTFCILCTPLVAFSNFSCSILLCLYYLLPKFNCSSLLDRLIHSQNVQQKLLRSCHYASDKRCGDFSLKMCQKCLAAGLRPVLLGELTAPPDTVAGFKGRERDRQGKEETEKAGKSAWSCVYWMDCACNIYTIYPNIFYLPITWMSFTLPVVEHKFAKL